MRKIKETELNRMALKGGAKVKRNPVSRVPTESEIAASNPKPTPTPPAAPPDSSIPFASMQASMSAINSQLGAVIESNTKAIAGFQDDLRRQMIQRPQRGPWDFFVHRDSSKLIERVRAVPIES